MINQMNTPYRLLTKEEEQAVVIRIINTLLDQSLSYSGKHRKLQWERGWGENLKEGDTTPRYFGKYAVHRVNGEFVLVDDKNFEIDQLHALVFKLANQYFKHLKDVYEFGCGTGHNLTWIKLANPLATLHGMDWTESSQKILKSNHLDAHNFDFFQPDYNIKIAKKAGIITIAALEQTGKNYTKFVSYLRRKKPEVVVHIEPIPELLDPTKLPDYLSIKYMEKRKYLSGYLDYLKRLQKEKKIKILEARRSGIGSLYVDGYSIIVWHPI